MFDNSFPLFSLADRARYIDRRLLSQTELADASFDARLSWHPGFIYHTAEAADCLFLLSDGGIFTTPHLTLPMGPLDRDRLQTIVDTVAPLFRAYGWPVRCLYVDACYVPLFEQLQGYRARIAYDRTFSDYLYDADRLRQLSGKVLHAKRNHFNRFLRTYPDYEFRPMTAEDAPEALALVREWCLDKGTDCQDMTVSDFRPIRTLLDNYDELQLRGGQIRIDGKLTAFELASEPINRTGVIHVEKARSDYPGLYAAINKLMLDHILPDIDWVNREEDLGIAGLRKAKLSYDPSRLIHKYEVILCDDT
jgi:hypothetical protein